MKRAASLILAVSITLLLSGLATAEIYKWVDEKGGTHYSDHSLLDGKSTGNVTKMPAYPDSPQSDYHREYDTPDTKSGSNRKALSPKELEPSASPEVELYVTSWCPYCKKAKEYLRSRGISFTEYDIEMDKSADLRKRELDSGRGVPFAVINGQKISGFVPSAYDSALRLRR